MTEDVHQRLNDLAAELARAGKLVSSAHVQLAADILLDDLADLSLGRMVSGGVASH